jgi:hypothetical protein
MDTTNYWYVIAKLPNPYAILLLGRTEKEYYKEGEEDIKRLPQPHDDVTQDEGNKADPDPGG